MDLSYNSKILLEKRYLLKNNDGKVIETAEELFRRVAKTMASVELLYGKTDNEIKDYEEKFYKIMGDLEFLPNSPTLYNSGTNLGQLSACFVLGIPDSLDGIFGTLHKSAKIFQCISEEQKILTKNGLKTAKEITTNDYLWTRNGWKKIIEKYDTGLQKCYKIITSFNSIIVGENHPILTYRVRGKKQTPIFRKTKKYSKNLRIGICLERPIIESTKILPYSFELFQKNGIKNCYKNITIPSETSEELMYFCGLWFGDGCKDNLRVRFTNSNDELNKYFTFALGSLFGIYDVLPKKYKGKNTFDIEVWSKKLSGFLEYIGFSKEKNNLPMEFLGHLPTNHLLAFFEGILDTDGSVIKNGNVILCINKSKKITGQLQLLLEDRGIYSTHHDYEYDGDINISHLYIHHNSLPLFASFMRQNTIKKRKIFSIIKTIKTPITKTKFLSYKIEEIGEKQTFDFLIEPPNEYLLDGIISHNSGGGCGYSFSNIRPENDVVQSTQGIASGPISFMEVYNSMCGTLKQGSKRRGAMMTVLRCDHPDILKFIKCKEEEGKLSNMNLSVAVTDSFMNAVENDLDFNLINPHDNKIYSTIKAKVIWKELMEHAWNNGEPSILFIDTINKANPTPIIGKIESTNPCAESPLLNGESCNLGSINLSKFVNNNQQINWEKLKMVVQLSVRFLDNVIDANNFPFEEIEKMNKANRKIGLGVMGWADMLIKMNIKYDSQEALDLADRLMCFIENNAKEMSQILGKEKGNFPNFNKSWFVGENSIINPPYMRNATLTSIAPTGSLSIIADASSGIEPVFSIITKRNVQNTLGKNLLEINSVVKEILKKQGKWADMKKALSSTECNKCIIIPKDIQDMVPTSQQIAPEWHLKMQAVFQKHTDLGISKTINLPNNTSIHDVEAIYMTAWKLGCKGTTVYRDGSRKFQLLTKEDGKCPVCTDS